MTSSLIGVSVEGDVSSCFRSENNPYFTQNTDRIFLIQSGNLSLLEDPIMNQWLLVLVVADLVVDKAIVVVLVEVLVVVVVVQGFLAVLNALVVSVEI